MALSRVSSLEGLHLLNFSARSIRAHPKVLQFMECTMNKLQLPNTLPAISAEEEAEEVEGESIIDLTTEGPEEK